MTAEIEKSEGLGNYWDRLLDKLINSQSEELLLGLPIYRCLKIWMQDENNHGRAVAAFELFGAFKIIEEKKSYGFRHQTTRSFGRSLANIRSNLQNFYRIELTKKDNRNIYSFWPLQS